MEKFESQKPIFKDIEDLEKTAGGMLGGDYFNPATGMDYDVCILNNNTVSVGVELAFRDSILKTLSKVWSKANNDKRFINVRQKGNSILADLIIPVGKITKVEFIVEKYRV
jgi:hypothetical protein